MKDKAYKYSLLVLLLLTITSSCSVKPYIPKGEQFYAGVKEIKYEDKDGSKHGRMASQDMESILKYKPNNSIFGSASTRLPINFSFYINKHFENSNNFFGRWLYKKFGDDPILISQVNPDLRAIVAKQVLDEYGYFRSSVVAEVNASGDSIIAKPSYYIVMNEPYLMDSISYHLDKLPQETQAELSDTDERLLHKDEPFGVRPLEEERNRISDVLRGKGYYFFKPTNIVYDADTVIKPKMVQLRVRFNEKTPAEAYKPWKIGNITYNVYDAYRSELTDSIYHKGVLYKFNKKSPVRLKVLHNRVRIHSDSLYNQKYQNQTIRSMAELNTFAYTDVSYKIASESDSTQNRLNVIINSQVDRPYFTELEGLFRWKSSQQVGPGVVFSVNKKNVFRGGELFNIRLNGNYEWQTNSSRSDKSWNINSYEIGLNTSLTFPRILIPGIANKPINYPATTKISLYSALLNRGKFYRQAKFGSDLTYRFEPNSYVLHSITPISVSYNHLLHQTDRFKEAIDKNPLLGLSFQNQFIPQMNYHYRFENQEFMSKHGFSIETYVAEAGGLLSLFYKGKTREDGSPHKFLGAPFAQFIKGSVELRYNYLISNKLKIATRAFAGAIWSYGNMLIAPYTEQFYVGGANSIRGYNVRGVGPGSFVPNTDNPLSFIDQTGDVRFESNIELRYKVIGDLELATFIDAGNIWLIRSDASRPNALLNGKYFLKEIALGTGLGLRYNVLDYLLLRFDVGLALHNPTREKGKYFNTFGKDRGFPVAFHFAIGYPF